MPSKVAAAAAGLAAVFLAIYLPAVGHGFISDDFRWIVESRADEPGDLVRLFGGNVGFYRPLVAATFAADYAVWTTNAFGYGLTNLALLFLSAALLWALARRFGLPPSASLLAVGVWLFNFHAVNMALLWLSGRTALLVSVFALATACLFLRGRTILAGVTCLAAMLSKEEAVALPLLLTVFDQCQGAKSHIVEEDLPAFAKAAAGKQVRLTRAARTWPLWAALPIYLALRLRSGAFWPTDAPSFYAFTLSPALIARNVVEYADRAGTVAIAIALLLGLVARVRHRHLDRRERLALIFAGLWIAATYALTVFLPVRSSLYALLPSIGSALAAGAVASAASRISPSRFTTVAAALLVLTTALIPLYRSRNVRWVELAELSARVMTTLEGVAAGRAGGHVVLVDDPDARFNLDSAFGSLFPEAVTLRLGDGWSGEVVAQREEAERVGDLSFQLADGTLVAR